MHSLKMKIGVISDTHIPVNTGKIPHKILEDFKGVELILHAGDLVEMSVFDTLRKIAPLFAVFGNMDSYQVKKTLPQKETIKVKKFKIGIVHGWGNSEELKNNVKGEFENVDVIVYGHSHSPVNEFAEGVLFFNPGSPTDKIYAPYNCYGILEINKNIEGRIIKL